jgi:hypothetical protein
VPRPSLMALALRRLVREVEDARAEGPQIHELQSLLIAPSLEEALPASHYNGMDHEPELVEEVVLNQRPDHPEASPLLPRTRPSGFL